MTGYDLISMPAVVFDVWIQGYQAGYGAGLDDGRDKADAEANVRMRAAARVVHAMGKLEPYDVHKEAIAERSRLGAERYRDRLAALTRQLALEKGPAWLALLEDEADEVLAEAGA